MKEKILCEDCEEFVETEVINRKTKAKVKGKDYEYTERYAICPNCKKEIMSNAMLEDNLKELDDSFRQVEGIISKKEIEDILKKYNIGKKPLSKLLGWGEITVTRYLNGDIPTKIYSDELIKILKNEQYMLMILNKNKKNISVLAYNSVYNSIKNIELGNKFKITNLDIVSQYLIMKIQEITPLTLQKILYYVQGFYYAFFNEFLFSEECQAWIHGPVFPKIYREYKGYKYNPINQSEAKLDSIEYLNDDKKKLLDAIATYLGCYSGKVLESMTHLEKPWIESRINIKVEESSQNIISKKVLGDYFKDIKESLEMEDVDDIKKYSEKVFKKVILKNKK